MDEEPVMPLPPEENLPKSMDNMDNVTYPPKKKGGFKVALLVLFALIVLAVVGGAGYYLAKQSASTNKKPATASSTTSTQPQSSSQSTSSTPKVASVTTINSSTTHYDSTNFNLGFDYPKDWTVSDTGNGSLTVTSPALQFVDNTNQTVNGEIIMTIQAKQTTVPAFAPGTAVAAIDSQKISYKKPTQNQRAQTYVTFANYKGSTASIDGLYITGDNGYQPGQSIPLADIIQDDPLISIGFSSCSDVACKATTNKLTATAIAVSSWSDPGLSKPLTNLLESLTIN